MIRYIITLCQRHTPRTAHRSGGGDTLCHNALPVPQSAIREPQPTHRISLGWWRYRISRITHREPHIARALAIPQSAIRNPQSAYRSGSGDTAYLVSHTQGHTRYAICRSCHGYHTPLGLWQRRIPMTRSGYWVSAVLVPGHIIHRREFVVFSRRSATLLFLASWWLV